MKTPPSYYREDEKHAQQDSVKNRPPIIVHCHLRWDFVWQRPQQIFSRLSDHYPVLFIEEPLLENSAPTIRVSEPYPNVLRLIPVLNGEATSFDEQCAEILPVLSDWLHFRGFGPTRVAAGVQWFYSPMVAPLWLGRFGEALVVYDCMDELANFRFAPPDMGARERFLLEKSNVVFTGGYHLFETKSRLHSNTHFYGCGVDAGHYGRARIAETIVPEAVAHLPRPILGYFGVIDERIDYDLLISLCQAFSGGSVVMVGPFAKIDPHTLPSLANLHWLGQRDYAELPALVKAFDVCLMPFALNESTKYINPTKTLEYMAAGKPIVSTAVPDVMRNFTPIVAVSHSTEEFIEAARRASANPDTGLIADGIVRAEATSWASTVAAMHRHILDAMEARQVPKTVKRSITAVEESGIESPKGGLIL
ncbi:MAG: glycosyltransferase [Candidatus Binatia bacterium]